jgi:NTE family protein
VIRARKVFDAIAHEIADRPIESFPMPFAAVATDLATGHELWLREGSLFEALRASTALPGLVSPSRIDGRWLVDGGLVNPVPVSVCRALGADVVIAVDLNTTLMGRHVPNTESDETDDDNATHPTLDSIRSAMHRFGNEVRHHLLGEEPEPKDEAPSIYDVVANSINIMQARVTRSRMAGDPPDLQIAPQLGDFGLFDFDRADVAIAEGRRATEQALAGANLPAFTPL